MIRWSISTTTPIFVPIGQCFIFTHAPCSSVGLQMDIFSIFFSFFSTPLTGVSLSYRKHRGEGCGMGPLLSMRSCLTFLLTSVSTSWTSLTMSCKFQEQELAANLTQFNFEHLPKGAVFATNDWFPRYRVILNHLQGGASYSTPHNSQCTFF